MGVCELPECDFRLYLPRPQSDLFDKNLKLAMDLYKLGKKIGIGPAQLALGWERGI